MLEKFLQAIRDFFEQNGLPYNEEDGVFYSEVRLIKTQDTALLCIVTNGFNINVSAAVQRQLPEDSLMELIRAANLTNSLISPGAMFIDLLKQYVSFRSGTFYTDEPIKSTDVALHVAYTLEMIEQIALGISHLGEEGWDAAKLVQTIMELPEDEEA